MVALHTPFSRPARVALAVLALLAFAPFGPGRSRIPLATAADDDLVVEGPHVVVRASMHRMATVEACRDTIEAAIPVYESCLPYKMPAGEKLEFRLCKDADEYRDVIKELKLEGFETNLAVTSWVRLVSVVCLQPRGDDAYLSAVGDLPEMTRHLVCHEGIHQWLRRAKAPNVDVWPDWWGEGIAEWVAERCLLASHPARTPISIDDPTYRVVAARSHDVSIPLRLLLHADASSFEPRNLLYHSFRDLVRVLAADPARFSTLSARLRDLLAPPQGARGERLVANARAFQTALESTYGALPELEKRLAKAPRSARWFQAGRTFEWKGDELVGAAFPDSSAALLSSEPAPGAPFDVTGEIWFGGGKGGQLDLILAYERLDEPRYVKIALGRTGYVTRLVYAYGNWQARYKQNADVDPALFPEATWLPIRLRVDVDRLEVRIGDKAVFACDVPPGLDVLHGCWGFGAYDSWGRFRRFEAKPSRPK